MNSKYSLPFKPSKLIEKRPAPYHRELKCLEYCIDWAMPEGTPILAARDGVVIERESRYNKSYPYKEYNGRCNRIILLHSNGEESVYVHLKWRSIKVKRGQVMALSGSTGYATYPHLHFGVYNQEGKNLKLNI